jgi:hypothetical protein
MKLPALILAFSASVIAGTFDVKSFGAKGDGSTLDTSAIQKAIDAAAKAHGTVVVPPGAYRTGAIFLKSPDPAAAGSIEPESHLAAANGINNLQMTFWRVISSFAWTRAPHCSARRILRTTR